MKEKILEIVEKICNMESTNCRSLNKSDLARELLDMANVPRNAEIWEIPLDWNDQVVVLFSVPEDENYYSLFAGIGTDGNFYFELSITGKFPCSEKFYFLEERGQKEIILPDDYFTHCHVINIKNDEDLRIAYDCYDLYKDYFPIKAIGIKREIRRYLKQSRKEDKEKIIKDYGIDGYIVLMELPDFLGSQEDAKEYFEEYHVIHAMPSIYDCTGQAFTSWYRIFKRNSRFMAFHSVCYDV